MDWFYVQNGQQTGPVAEAELSHLLEKGDIQPETLVWHAGMTEWRPYGSASPGALATEAEPVRFCGSCGKLFPSSDLALFGETAICAACKPGYVQRLRQGMVSTSGITLNYGGFWIRVAAVLIDGIIGNILVRVILIVFGVTMAAIQPLSTSWYEFLFGSLVFGLVWNCFFWTQYGATPGKMVLKLKVTTPDGGGISLGRAVGRHFALFLDSCTLGIGFMMAGWDSEKRTLHDRIAGTRVIRKR